MFNIPQASMAVKNYAYNQSRFSSFSPIFYSEHEIDLVMKFTRMGLF